MHITLVVKDIKVSFYFLIQSAGPSFSQTVRETVFFAVWFLHCHKPLVGLMHHNNLLHLA